MDTKVIPLRPWMLGVAFLIGFSILLGRFFGNLWRFEIHQFFPLALAGAVYLAWRGCEETARPLKPGSLRVVTPLTIFFLLLLGFASLFWSPWIGYTSTLVAIVAAAYWLGGWDLLRNLLPGWIMLLTLIPPPLRLDKRLALALQHWAVVGSSEVLDLLGVPHLREGNILSIPGKQLLVEEACSGVNSVLFMSSACVFYVLWRRRPILFLPVIFFLTIGAVLLGNLFRITSGAWLLFNFHVDLFSGWRHETLGLVLTASYLLFIIGADSLLSALFRIKTPTPAGAAVSITKNRQPVLSLTEGRSLRWGIVIVFGLIVLLGMVQLKQAWIHSYRHYRTFVNPAELNGAAKFVMPEQIEGWTLSSPERPTPSKSAYEGGIYSHVWHYTKDGLEALIALDYPFFDYHDVRICYQGQGWLVGEGELTGKVGGDQKGHAIPSMVVTLSKENGLRARLLYSTIDEEGQWIDKGSLRSDDKYDERGWSLKDFVFSRLLERLRRSWHYQAPDTGGVNYRIQTLASAHGGLNERQQLDESALFMKSRELLTDQFVKKPLPSSQKLK